METIEFTKKQFKNLRLYELSKGINATECKLYVIPAKTQWVNEEKLLKRLYIDEGKTFSNKLYTINTLIDEKNRIGIEELIMPDKLAIVDKRVVGFTMPYIESINLCEALEDYRIPFETKIDYLRQIGKILKKIETVRKYDIEPNFYLNDIHEQNFIINAHTGRVNVVDLDSCRIGKNQPFPAKILSTNVVIDTMPTKYPKSGGMHIPTNNTDLLCYNFLILNFIASAPMHKVDLSEFYTYLEYLLELGFNRELISCFAKLYVVTDNQNPEEYLSKIEGQIGKANYRAFKYQLNKK